MDRKTIIGVKEHVTIIGKSKKKTVVARIDTGAAKSSIDRSLATELELGPVIKYKTIKSAHGIAQRGVILARARIAGRTFRAYFTIADRQHMKHAVLIGRNILKKGFLIDPSKPLR